MTDKPTTDPDVHVEKSPFPLPNEEPKPVSPFATKPDTQVLTKQADAKFEGIFVKPDITPRLILGMLIDLPDDIFEYQKIYDTVLIQYETRLSDLTFQAFSRAMFPGKKEGEPIRVAANEEERKVAVSQVLVADEKMKILTNELNEAKNELTLAKNKFEAAKIAANLLAVQ